MGRPRGTTKAPQEKFLSKNIRFPPGLWGEIERRVPLRERSAFIRRAIERELETLPEADAGKPLCEWILDLAASVPDKVVERLPRDGASERRPLSLRRAEG